VSTSGLIKICDEHDNNIATILVHSDGYPNVLGQDLLSFNTLKIINGYALGQENFSNGMGCFAASLIAHLKQGVGNVYMIDNNIDVSPDYTYKILFNGYNNYPIIKVCGPFENFRLLSEVVNGSNSDSENIQENTQDIQNEEVLPLKNFINFE